MLCIVKFMWVIVSMFCQKKLARNWCINISHKQHVCEYRIHNHTMHPSYKRFCFGKCSVWFLLIRDSNNSSRLMQSQSYAYKGLSGQQYASATGHPLHHWINGHWHDVMHWSTEVSPVTDHFNDDEHSIADITVMVIDQKRSRDPCLRKIKVSRWIRTLGPHTHWEWTSGSTPCEALKNIQGPCGLTSPHHHTVVNCHRPTNELL